MLANKNNPLKLIYAKGEYIDVAFEDISFYRVPKNYRRRFREISKTEAFSI